MASFTLTITGDTATLTPCAPATDAAPAAPVAAPAPAPAAAPVAAFPTFGVVDRRGAVLYTDRVEAGCQNWIDTKAQNRQLKGGYRIGTFIEVARP